MTSEVKFSASYLTRERSEHAFMLYAGNQAQINKNQCK